MRLASSSAAASNSLQPSVPASVAERDMRSLAQVREGGSPSRRITVATTTYSPFASRAARSSSRLGTGGAARECGGDDFARPRDVVNGGGIAGRQTETSKRLIEVQAHGQQHVRWIERPRRACRSARSSDARDVKREQHVLALAVGEGAGREVGQAIFAAGETPAQRAGNIRKGGRLLPRFDRALDSIALAYRYRGGEGQRGNDVFVTGAAAPLLRASIKERIDTHAVFDVDCAAASGAELVPAEGDDVGVAGDWNPARTGACVDVHEGTDRVRAIDHVASALDRADLVVGEAHRKQRVARRNRIR